MTRLAEPVDVELPEGVLVVRRGPGANCSSAGSAIDVLFYASAVAGAVAIALAAAMPRRDDEDDGENDGAAPHDASAERPK